MADQFRPASLSLAPHPDSPLAPQPSQNEFTGSKGKLKIQLPAQRTGRTLG